MTQQECININEIIVAVANDASPCGRPDRWTASTVLILSPFLLWRSHTNTSAPSAGIHIYLCMYVCARRNTKHTSSVHIYMWITRRSKFLELTSSATPYYATLQSFFLFPRWSKYASNGPEVNGSERSCLIYRERKKKEKKSKQQRNLIIYSRSVLLLLLSSLLLQ